MIENCVYLLSIVKDIEITRAPLFLFLASLISVSTRNPAIIRRGGERERRLCSARCEPFHQQSIL